MARLQNIVLFILLSWCTFSAQSQKVDLTRTEYANGSEVVDAVISILRRSCIFEDDLLRLRSKAYTDTKDGEQWTTYIMGYKGGIWHISEADLRRTQTEPDLRSYRDAIQQKLFINWATVTYNDLRKPLYSALASQLNMILDRIAPLTPGSNRRTDPALTKENFDPRSLPKNIQHNLDLVFMLDNSASLSEADFNRSKDFVNNFIALLNVDGGLVKIGVVQFSTMVYQTIKLNNPMTSSQLQQAVSEIKYKPGGTNTDVAFQYVNNTMFTAAHGSRDNAAKVVVLVTDGTSDDSAATILAARTLRASGVTIFAVGVGASIEQEELTKVVNQPSCVHMQAISGYENLPSDSFNIAKFVVEAPVMLKPGEYEFDCSTDLRAVVMKTGHPTTVQVSTSDGNMDVFGSTGEFVPNPAIYSFKNSLSSRIPVNIYIRDGAEIQLAFRNSTSGGCLSQFTLKIEYGDLLKTGSYKICVQSGLPTDCTVKDLVDSPFIEKGTVSEPSLTGTCSGSDTYKAPYPYRSDRYLMCEFGKLVVIYCDANQQYDERAGICVPVGPAIAMPSVHMETTTTLPQVIPAAVLHVCTPEHLEHGNLIFPYPGNDRLFIRCGISPYHGTVVACEENKIFSDAVHTCVIMNEVHQPVSNPCRTDFPDVQYHPHPTDKARFIQCDQYGHYYIMSCNKGEIWSEDILNCITPGYVYQTVRAPGPLPG